MFFFTNSHVGVIVSMLPSNEEYQVFYSRKWQAKKPKKNPMNLVNATTPASTQVGEHVLVVSEPKLPYHLK